MFYEKLAAAKEDKRQGDFSGVGALGGAAAGIAATAGSRQLRDMSGKALQQAVQDNPDELKRILRGMGGTESGGQFTLKGKDGRAIRVDIDSPIHNNAMYDPTERVFGNDRTKRGRIAMGTGFRDKDVFFHELGHATGAGSKSKMTRLNAGARLAGQVLTGAGGLTRLGGLGAAGYAAGAGNKAQADKANRISNAMLLSSAITEAPTLLEEARATIRANGLSKKFTGKGINKLKLGKAYGTYLGGALMNASPALLAKGIAKYKQRKYRDEKTAAKEESDYASGLARGYAGALAGGALGATAGIARMGRGVAMDQKRVLLPALVGTGLGAYAGYRYHKAQRRKERQ